MAIHLSLLPQRKPWPERAAWFRFRLSVDCITATCEGRPDFLPAGQSKKTKTERTGSAERCFACWTPWSCKTAVSHTLAVLLCCCRLPQNQPSVRFFGETTFGSPT